MILKTGARLSLLTLPSHGRLAIPSTMSWIMRESMPSHDDATITSLQLTIIQQKTKLLIRQLTETYLTVADSSYS
jgi:hypothetical protein